MLLDQSESVPHLQHLQPSAMNSADHETLEAVGRNSKLKYLIISHQKEVITASKHFLKRFSNPSEIVALVFNSMLKMD